MNPQVLNQAVEFLFSEGWKARFTAETLNSAALLAKKNKLSEACFEWIQGDNLIIQAEISDNGDEFRPEIVLWPEKRVWQVESTCSCMQKHECAHAAAILFQLARKEDLADIFAGKQQVSAAKSTFALEEQTTADAEQGALERIRLEPQFLLQLGYESITSKQEQQFYEILAGTIPRRWLVAKPVICYGEFQVAPLKPTEAPLTRVIDSKTSSPILLERAQKEEEKALSLLRRTGLTRLSSHPLWRRLHKGKPPLQEWWIYEPSTENPAYFWGNFRSKELPVLEKNGWKVEFPNSLGYQIVTSDPAEWEARLQAMDSSWFSLSVGFSVAGEVHNLLPILTNLLAENILEESLDRPNSATILVPLSTENTEHILEIPLGRLRRILKQLFATLHPNHLGEGKEVRLHSLDAAALAEKGDLAIPEVVELTSLRAFWQDSSAQKPAKSPLPKGLKATLRPYQEQGFQWMQFLRRCQLHGILADDMGLGKTLQTIAHILAELESGRNQGNPSLVVAPTSVVPNWLAEVRRFAPKMKVLDATGALRNKVLPYLDQADLVVTSYALLHRDLKRLSKFCYHVIVLDEAQYIKNPAAQTTVAAKKLSASLRLCLSGTPIENHLGELWSQFSFLQPGFLGTKEEFQQQFRHPIEKLGSEARQELLRSRLAPLILRRHKSEVAKDLPPKTELIHTIELSDAQKDLYEGIRASMDKQVRQALAIGDEQDAQMLFLSALLKLRQVCCDPRLLNPPPGGNIPSAKLAATLDLIEQLISEGSHILLFSQFTSMLDLLAQELNNRKVEYLQLTGASKNRGQLVERFQTGDVPLFLISLKAGGTGLNLTKADTVIHYDPWWNPAVEAQATDRAYRIGQTRPVFVHKLLCEHSVEERIYKMQQEKSSLSKSILAGTNRAAKLDASLFEELLSPAAFCPNLARETH